MLSNDPFKLLEGKLPKPIKITFKEAEKFIKDLNINIGRVGIGRIKRERASYEHKMKIISAKAFHFNDGILGEYKIIPEISIGLDGKIHHVMRSLFGYGNMPEEIIVHTEEENSGIRCIDLKVFGINKTLWGTEEEVKEIVEAMELIKETKETIIGRLKLDGISVL